MASLSEEHPRHDQDDQVEEPQDDKEKETVEEAKDEDKGKEEPNNNFECNICLDVARDAVISLCGHLFCWPCLHQWLETRPNR